MHRLTTSIQRADKLVLYYKIHIGLMP